MPRVQLEKAGRMLKGLAAGARLQLGLQIISDYPDTVSRTHL